MEKKRYDYESRWNKVVYPETGARFATDTDLVEEFSATPLNTYATAAGIPLCFTDTPRNSGRGKADGEGTRRAVVNDNTENTLIYGETGSMKTRAVIRPLIFSLACRRESMVVTDPKGELASDPKVRGLLDEMGYQSAFLDFRSFAGDGYNILEYAFDLYRQGQKDKAVANLSSIVHALTYNKNGARIDPFWPNTSRLLLTTVLHALVDVYACREDGADYVNILSLASALSDAELEEMEAIFNYLTAAENTSTVMFRGVRTGSDGTKANVTVSAASYLQPFLIQPSLARMLSRTTFDVDAMYDKPTAVFIIVPDESSAYDEISGLLIDNFYSRMIDRYTREYQNRKQPRCRVNFVCDEFCNLRINDIGPKISACRSRQIRFYIVCQSMKQLEETYPDAAIIEGNCKNLLFLGSSDPGLIDHVCSLCGTTTVTPGGMPENLVTPAMLRGLGKQREYKEALFVRDRLVYFARLADCDTYDLVKKYASPDPARIPKRVNGSVSFVRPSEIRQKIIDKELPQLFTPLEDRPEWFREPLWSMRFGEGSGTDAKTIVHPKYGLGEVLDVKDSPRILHVRFPGVGVKQLGIEWVVKNCQLN